MLLFFCREKGGLTKVKIAFALTTISTELVLKYIIDLVAAEKTSIVVIGFPVNLDGSLNDISYEGSFKSDEVKDMKDLVAAQKFDISFFHYWMNLTHQLSIFSYFYVVKGFKNGGKNLDSYVSKKYVDFIENRKTKW